MIRVKNQPIEVIIKHLAYLKYDGCNVVYRWVDEKEWWPFNLGSIRGLSDRTNAFFLATSPEKDAADKKIEQPKLDDKKIDNQLAQASIDHVTKACQYCLDKLDEVNARIDWLEKDNLSIRKHQGRITRLMSKK